MYAVIGDPLSFGADQLITTFDPKISVFGDAGFSGL